MAQRLELIIELEGKRQTLRDLNDIKKAIGAIEDEADNSGAALSSIGDGIGGLAFQFNNVLQAAQTLFSQLQQGYGLLIGQNEEFNQGLLESAASLSANADILQGGALIVDPTEAIVTLQGPIEESIRRVEEATRSLVGVTERETAAIFNTILSNSAQLADQSREFPDAIRAAESLAPGLTAALGTLQIPLQQANQEIRSLLQGQIDQNSAIAQALQISPDDIRRAQQAGEAVDFLRERFEPFVAANALAAQSISGITSNIQGLIEVAARDAGLPLFDALVEQLGRLEAFLTENEDAIQEFTTNLVAGFTEAVMPIGDVLVDEVIPALGEFIAAIADSQSDLQGLVSAFSGGAADLLSLLAGALRLGADNAELLDTALKALLVRFLALRAIAVVSSIQALGAAFVSVTTATVAASASLGATNAGLLLLAGSATPAAVGLSAVAASAGAAVVAAAPLVGVLVGIGAAVEGIKFAQFTLELAEANVELERTGAIAETSVNQANAAIGRTIELTNAANQARERGTQLSEQEIEQAERLISANNLRLQQFQDQLAELEDARRDIPDTSGIFGFGDDAAEAQANALDAQIQEVSSSIERLTTRNQELSDATGVAADGLEIQRRSLTDLGDVSDQVAQQLEQNLQRVTAGTGSIQEATEAAKETLSLTQQALELGVISSEEAIANIRAVADQATLTAETRISAQQALTQVEEQENERRLQANRTAQQEVQRLVAEGTIRDIEGQRRITVLRQQELEQRLADTRRFLQQEQESGRGDGARAQELIQQVEELQTQVIEARVESERLARQAQLEEIERTQREATQLIEDSERDRLIATQQLVNAGVISQQEADQQRLDSTRDRIEQELALEQQRLQQLENIPLATDPEEREAQEQEIRNSISRTSQLQLDLLENERQAQEALAQRAQQLIEDNSRKFVEGQEARIAAINAETQALQRENQLLAAQQNLTQAEQGFDDTASQLRIDQLNEAIDLQRRLADEEDAGIQRVIRARLQQLGIRGDEESIAGRIADEERDRARQAILNFQQQAEFRQQQLAIEIELEAAAARRLALEARLQQVNAQVALSQAEQIVDPEERERAVRAAEIQAQLAGQAVNEAEAQVNAQADLATLSQRVLETQLETEEVQIRAASEAAIFAANLREAEISAANINDSLSGVSAPNVGAFRRGGVAQPGLALVGEGGPELIRVGSTSRVFNNADTMAIAQRALSSTGINAGAMNRQALSGGQMGSMLREMQGLRKDISKLQSGVNIQRLNMPQNIGIEASRDRILEEVAGFMRNWERSLTNLGR